MAAELREYICKDMRDTVFSVEVTDGEMLTGSTCRSDAPS